MSACPYGCDGGGTLYVRRIERLHHRRDGRDIFIYEPSETGVPCDCRTVKQIIGAMNTVIGDTMGLGYCSSCGDALVWNYEAMEWLCDRCQQ